LSVCEFLPARFSSSLFKKKSVIHLLYAFLPQSRANLCHVSLLLTQLVSSYPTSVTATLCSPQAQVWNGFLTGKS
jgi:ABC-type microcin C transport system permease subunit YejB